MSPKPTLTEPGDLTGFPWAHPPATLHRVCRQENGTWWFSSDGSGRFDLGPPEGTCYFSTDRYEPDGVRAAGVEVLDPPHSDALTILP